ncbi:MAG: hypothetical protein LBK98_09135, partial [Peptococcaceae bacterium]|nr:hypothetical protein [Peptococcaceae bacterium]
MVNHLAATHLNGRKTPASKKLLAITLVLTLLLSLLPAVALAAGAGYTPNGTMTQLAANPALGVSGTYWTIASGTEMQLLATYINAGSNNSAGVTFYQIADVDLSQISSWQPIGGMGNSITTMNYFKGYFDGSLGDGATYYEITGMSIQATTTSQNYMGWGLFGASSGTIANVTLGGGISLVAPTPNQDVGGVVGYSTGIIWNCHNSVSVTTGLGSSMVGGIAGAVENPGAGVDMIYVRYCSNTGTIIGGSRIGGIAGAVYGDNNHDAVVDNCFNKSEITCLNTSTKAYAGGLVGYCEGYISNSYAYNTILQTGLGGHYLAGAAGFLSGYDPQAAMSNTYALSFFDGNGDPDYDRWLFASVDDSSSMFISNSLWVDTYNWSGYPQTPEALTQPVPASGNPWGTWTSVGRFGSGASDYDSKTAAYVYDSSTAVWSAATALTVLNADSPGVAEGDQYRNTVTTVNDGYPYLTWEQAGNIPAAPVAPTIPPKPEVGIFLDGVNGNDSNTGRSPATAVKTFARAQDLLDPASSIYTIYITNTVTVSGTETWALGGPNLYKVTRSADAPTNAPLVVVASGGTLNLGGTALTPEIVIDGNDAILASASLFRIDTGGILNIRDGADIIDAVSDMGGAITVNGGTLNMSDGWIRFNQARYGGAVYIAGGTANISGGTISDNEVSRYG